MEKIKKAEVYKITSPSNRIYIGSSGNAKNRFKYYYRLECKTQVKLFRSLEKYGVENHTLEIIEECESIDRNRREAYWGKFYDVLGENGLNCILPKSEDYISVSEETRKRHKERPRSEETLQMLKTMNIGRKHTDEARQNYSLCKIGNKSTTGQTQSTETKLKKSISLKGRIIKSESIEKKRITNANRQPTEREINTRLNHPSSKLVLNIEMGIYYNSAKQADKYSSYKPKKVISMLSGSTKNTSPYIYV